MPDAAVTHVPVARSLRIEAPGSGLKRGTMLYDAYQTHTDLLLPLRTAAGTALTLLDHPGETLRSLRLPYPGCDASARMAAAFELIARAQLTHARPEFEIGSVSVGGDEIGVREEVVLSTPFAKLLRFAKDIPGEQPRVLLAAPMSGHFATLLRETVRTLLADHEVYVTDWGNARDISVWHGAFGLDEYVAHLIHFLETIGPDAHLVAVCQPCVAALAAVAAMAQGGHPARPASMTLMAGPVDCRINPTRVNELATSQPIDWFESRLITTVPLRFRGAFRRVYPGFLQLSAFMSMNLERHVKAFVDLYNAIIDGEHEKIEGTRSFYREYFAVADLPAEFYLDTVRLVFQDYALARGALTWQGCPIEPAAIRGMALLTVEGERDDICSIGQTMAAHDLTPGIRPYLKQHHMQAGVGHYGVFSGRRWQHEIYPIVRDMIHQVNARRPMRAVADATHTTESSLQ